MSTRQEIIKLVKDGFTAKEIKETLGLKRESQVHTYAKQCGLKVAKANTRKVEAIRKMADSGMHYDAIAKEIGTDVKALRALCKRNEIVVALKPKMKGVYNSNDAIAALSKHNPDWEFIGGYTGSEGSMVVRHKCGYTARKSCATIRHNKIRCDLCDLRDRKTKAEEQKRQKAVKREVAKFYRKVKKQEQETMKECPICGCFFYSSRSKYCSNECSKEPAKHYYNMKKRRRQKQSWTEESKSISLLKLYERDGGVCWICGGLCDYDADSNDNNYPSIDHVIPIAKGGMDEWDNVKLAHRLCNSLKGMEIVKTEPVGISSRSQAI